MRNLFGGGDSTNNPRAGDAGRVPRHSSGWNELLKYLRAQDSLRILDIGPTSSTNINYITNLGHSIYMANVVEEASKPEWLIPGEAGDPPSFDVEANSQTTLRSKLWRTSRLDVGPWWNHQSLLTRANQS